MQKYFNKFVPYIITKHKRNYILVCISGGQDSICLIKLIENLKKVFYNYTINYIYIDHQWTKNSKKQTYHIINYIRQSNQQLYIYQITQGSFSENNARKYRYHLIFNHALKYKYNIIMTAHSQTDKIETCIFNLIRGTSLEGITSLNLNIQLDNKISLLRPLILNDRTDINFFCKRWCLPIWIDKTNYNFNIYRNRIRNEVIPYFKTYINYNTEKSVLNFIQNCYYDNEYIKKKSIIFYCTNINKYYIKLNYNFLIKQHISIQIKVLQIFIYFHFNLIIHKYFLIHLIYYFHLYKSKIRTKQFNILQWKNLKFYLNKQCIYTTIVKNRPNLEPLKL
uniref:tRNA(Ile)-lysidine synthase, chloroplastic n=1 Tax=Taenioma perpusillum TaxID=210852 RepID=A0A1Z1MQU0_9FLOR|nr:tRNA Ile-lysidine synthetase [Taenioma perpusillum]ARW68447.1 tRNA Ile-lysidine synthetase [Taenioma perpusillum]